MLKRVLACTAVLALCALPLAAQGHAATAGNEMTITGQVVDLNCFTTNGQSGAGHKACAQACAKARSEEHTSELQSRLHLVCRLLLEKKKKNTNTKLVEATQRTSMSLTEPSH